MKNVRKMGQVRACCILDFYVRDDMACGTFYKTRRDKEDVQKIKANRSGQGITILVVFYDVHVLDLQAFDPFGANGFCGGGTIRAVNSHQTFSGKQIHRLQVLL